MELFGLGGDQIDKSDVDNHLLLAICNQHMELVQELVKKGGEVNCKYDGDRNPPFGVVCGSNASMVREYPRGCQQGATRCPATGHSMQKGHVGVVKVLVEHGGMHIQVFFFFFSFSFLFFF